MLKELRRLHKAHPDQKELATNLKYLHKRQAQLEYPHFIQQGWPIGSGMVERANKLVVEARLKGAGMHWQRCNVDPMLALRNLVCNHRWVQAWPTIKHRLIAQAEQKRTAPCRERLQAIRTQEQDARLAAQREQYAQYCAHFPDGLAGSKPDPPLTATPSSRKPAPNHPWRRAYFGTPKHR